MCITFIKHFNILKDFIENNKLGGEFYIEDYDSLSIIFIENKKYSPGGDITDSFIIYKVGLGDKINRDIMCPSSIRRYKPIETIHFNIIKIDTLL